MSILHVSPDILEGCSGPGLVLLRFAVKDVGEELVQEGAQLARAVLDGERAAFKYQSEIGTDLLHEDPLEGRKTFGSDPLCQCEHLAVGSVLALTPGQEGGMDLACPGLTLREPCDLIASPWLEPSAAVLSGVA